MPVSTYHTFIGEVIADDVAQKVQAFDFRPPGSKSGGLRCGS